MLRRFQQVIDTIRTVRTGNLSVKVPYVGDDEIGLLGDQVNQMLERISVLMDENVKKELLAKNSEIRALHSQINAHFIYNVLETIRMMAEVDSNYEISDAITSLGKLLRYSMRWTSENVSLEEELEHLENYLLLINLRYDYQISLHKAFAQCLYNQRIPKLTLQPIVENAVIHSIEEIAMDTVIEISASEYESHYTITITDHGKGIEPAVVDALNTRLMSDISEGSDAGIGLKNVHDRIVNAFGSEYGVSIESQLGIHTSVTMRLPYTGERNALL
jgi:two-component system sensor histidine kinase YesM